MDGHGIDAALRRGRAAGSNRPGRFEPYVSMPVDDGWSAVSTPSVDGSSSRARDDGHGGAGMSAPPVRTEVASERPRSAITRNTSPDIGFDRSINPYRGCEHGCIYCFARPSHAYLGLSPGLDFETRLIARPGIDRVLAAELARKAYRPGVIAIGTNTDPYQPLEARMGLMRAMLTVLAAHRHPVMIATKGTLIERDIDILRGLATEGLVRVGLSVTTLDPDVARAMEPRVPHPARRLQTIRRLTEAGIPVRVMVSPVVPGLTDHEIEAILAAARHAGATLASMIPLRLPREVAPLFRDWLSEHFPGRAAKVMGRVREMHGGRDYDAEWGRRMTGQGIWADLLQRRFGVATRRLGYDDTAVPLRCDLFCRPLGDAVQPSLFD